MMDSSFLVSFEDYVIEKNFVKNIAKALNVSPGKSRAAVITYGERSILVARYGDYSTHEQLKDIIDRAPSSGGVRRIDRALGAGSIVLQQSRPNVPKIVVLLTAGRQHPAADAKSLDEAAKPLREQGAKTYVIAIGREPDKTKLGVLVDTPDKVLEIDDFRGLNPQVPSIAKKIIDGLCKFNVIVVIVQRKLPSTYCVTFSLKIPNKYEERVARQHLLVLHSKLHIIPSLFVAQEESSLYRTNAKAERGCWHCNI
jgi:hypothetical protein